MINSKINMYLDSFESLSQIIALHDRSVWQKCNLWPATHELTAWQSVPTSRFWFSSYGTELFLVSQK
jgi:hypothetical protein